MPRKIGNLRVMEIALVDEPANERKFLLFKRAEKAAHEDDEDKAEHPAAAKRVTGSLAPDDTEWDVGEETMEMDVEQIAAGSVIFRGKDPDVKASYSLLVRNRDGLIVPNAVRNARARVSQVEGVPADVISDANDILEGLMERVQEQADKSAGDSEASKGARRVTIGTLLDDVIYS